MKMGIEYSFNKLCQYLQCFAIPQFVIFLISIFMLEQLLKKHRSVCIFLPVLWETKNMYLLERASQYIITESERLKLQDYFFRLSIFILFLCSPHPDIYTGLSVNEA